MATWTAEITGVEKGKLNFNVSIRFLKDGQAFDTAEVPNIHPFSSIYPWIEARLSQYKKVDDFDASAAIGPVDLDNPVKEPETASDKERAVFFERYAEYKKMFQAVSDGFLKADDQGLADLLATLKSTNKPEYGVF